MLEVVMFYIWSALLTGCHLFLSSIPTLGAKEGTVHVQQLVHVGARHSTSNFMKPRASAFSSETGVAPIQDVVKAFAPEGWTVEMTEHHLRLCQRLASLTGATDFQKTISLDYLIFHA